MTVSDDVRAARGWAWRLYADSMTRLTRRGSAAAGLASFGDANRRDLRTWNERLSDGHTRYRRDHAPAASAASVVCVSRRPHLLNDIVANVARQVSVGVDFVLVTNDPGFDEFDVDGALESVPGARRFATEPDTSLGQCLNLGIEAANERFVAKFDDDDHYGPNYLVDSLRAHGFAGAGVVGKHSYYAEFPSTSDRYLRFPGHEFSYSSTLAGGTLVIDRTRVGALAFPDISLGEDRAFIARCHRRGISTFAADRFNFLQRRGTDNTWSIPTDAFLIDTQLVDADDGAHDIDR